LPPSGWVPTSLTSLRWRLVQARQFSLSGNPAQGSNCIPRDPLAGQPVRLAFPADESVEVVESQTGGPVIERTHAADLGEGRVMPFAESRGAVAVLLQHRGNRNRAPGPDAVIAGIADGLFFRNAETDLMIIAAGEQRGAGGEQRLFT
jgi:hypothetical protein